MKFLLSITENFWASSAIKGTKILKKVMMMSNMNNRVMPAPKLLGILNLPIFILVNKATKGAPSKERTAETRM